jgi:hypothetical protein
MKTAHFSTTRSANFSSNLEVLTKHENQTNTQTAKATVNSGLFRTNLNSSLRLSNSLQANVGPLVEAITRHARLPSFHDLAIDPDVSDKAISLLGRLLYNYPIKVPTFFPQEGETIVLKWDGEKIGRYLSISLDDISLMDVEPFSQKYCEYELTQGSNFDFETLVAELTNISLSSTAIQVQDA